MDTDQTAHEEEQKQPTEGQEAQEQETQDEEKQKPFTKDQEAYIGSWLGRIVKNQIDEHVLPEIRKMSVSKPPTQPVLQGDALQKFNEQLQEKILENPMEAINMVLDVREKAKKNLESVAAQRMTAALTEFSSDDTYKEVFPEANKLAKKYLDQGHAPQLAAQLGFQEAKLKRLEGGSKWNEGSLSMASGGMRRQETKAPKLPDALRTAYERDKKDGFAKDEKQWIGNLSTETRRKYGL